MSEEEDKPIKDEESAADALEELSEAIDEELEEFGEEESDKPVAVILDSPQVIEQLARVGEYFKKADMKSVAQQGLQKTQRNIIIFYEHASEVGERLRGMLFFLLGASILTTALFLTEQSLFTIKDFLALLAETGMGRFLTGAVGVCFIAYGLQKAAHGLVDKVFPPKKTTPWVQKKLVEEIEEEREY